MDGVFSEMEWVIYMDMDLVIYNKFSFTFLWLTKEY